MSISPGEFDLVRSLVLDQAGIVLDPGKEYLVESRLQPLARREACGSIAELIERLANPVHSGLKSKVVDVMTTNETTFFRDGAPFDALRTHVLPALIDARRQTKRLSIWYAASSTGQEPYSVSMLIHDHFPQLLGWDLHQLATDISPSVLARARQGRYVQVEVNRGLPPNCLAKYFEREGDEWQLKDVIRRMVQFEELNLIRPWAAIGDFDIVMIRNVMIYFDVPTKKRILGRLRQLLKPDGYMFLGGAETTMNLDEHFVRQPFERAGCYRLRAS